MADRLLLALAQLNPVVGDIVGNMGKILSGLPRGVSARGRSCHHVRAGPSGYQPEDFVLKPRVHKVIREAVESWLVRRFGPCVAFGFALGGRGPALQCRAFARRRSSCRLQL